jgi:hypothetical protein
MKTAIITLEKTDELIFTVTTDLKATKWIMGDADSTEDEDKGWEKLLTAYRKMGYRVITK